VTAKSHSAAALAELDKVLDAKPHVDGHTLSVATQQLSALRDKMATQQRNIGPTPDSRRRLEHINAVISVVLAVHFPSGSVPWPELQKARNWLADLVQEDAAEA
jgi:hypothetical protein